MTRILRSACVSLFAVGVAASLVGCKTDCTTEDGKTTCIGESTTQYTGTPILQEVAWSAGQGVTISVAGGNLRFNEATTSITVNPQGAALGGGCTDVSKVCVRFTPINNDTKERRDEATRQMKTVANGGNLDLSATNNGTGVVAAVNLNGSTGAYNSSLSALVDVYLPAGFDGDLIANTATGGVSVRGARRGATVKTGQGDIAFDLDGIAAGNSRGDITTGNGDISFNGLNAANISIQGDARGAGGLVTLAGNTANWSQVAGSTDQAATFCGGTACAATGAVSDGNWVLKTELGQILVTLR